MSDNSFKIVNGEKIELTDAEIAELASLQSEWEAGVTDRQWAVVRTDRNARLAASDWTQLADNPLSGEKRALWADYRQALRDITTQADPFNISWPVEP